MRSTVNNGFIAIGLLLVIAGLISITLDLTRAAAAPSVAESSDDVIVIGTMEIQPSPTASIPAGAGMEALLEPVLTVTPGALPEKPGTAATAAPVLEAGTEAGQDSKQAVEEIPSPADPEPPVRLVIPQIGLDAPVVAAESQLVELGGQQYQQWLAPYQFAAGWHTTSARLGEPGNTVLNGHHNIWGEVFKDLVKLEVGDQIMIGSEEKIFKYRVVETMILPERGQPPEVRQANAQWLMPTSDERVTLITCWPYESNTHRLIIVAVPEQIEEETDPSWR